LYRALVRHVVEHPKLNAQFSAVARALTEENRWRAQRYGTTGTYVDVATREAKPFKQMLDETLDLKNDRTIAQLAETARATFALKAGVWFRRARFFIFAPDSQAQNACRQAEIPLRALFKIPGPPQVVDKRANFGRVTEPARHLLESANTRHSCLTQITIENELVMS
jgi:hypothetical protein